MIKKTANKIDSGAYPEFAPNQTLASGASVVVTDAHGKAWVSVVVTDAHGKAWVSVVVTDAHGKAWVIDPHSGTAKLLTAVHTKAR